MKKNLSRLFLAFDFLSLWWDVLGSCRLATACPVIRDSVKETNPGVVGPVAESLCDGCPAKWATTMLVPGIH